MSRDELVDAWDEGYRAGLEDMSAVRAGDMTIQNLSGNPYRNECEA